MATLLTLLIILTPFCCVGGTILGVAVLMLKFVLRRRTLTDDEIISRQHHALAALEAERHRLVPWAEDAYLRMGADWRGSYRRFGSFVATGYCPERAQLDQALFITRLDLSGAHGALVACTTEQVVRIAITPEGADVTIDDELLGRVPLGAGSIRDPSGAPIGRSERERGSEVYTLGLEIGDPHRAYPVFLADRQIAVLHTAGSLTGVDLIDGQPPRLVLSIIDDLTPDEAKWVLALCVVEVGYHAARRTLHRSRSRHHG